MKLKVSVAKAINSQEPAMILWNRVLEKKEANQEEWLIHGKSE